jgi:hypothetical protein
MAKDSKMQVHFKIPVKKRQEKKKLKVVKSFLSMKSMLFLVNGVPKV